MTGAKEHKRTVISYDPLWSLLLEREISPLQLARIIGERVSVIRNIQLHPETTTMEIIRRICEALDCEPGDIMKAEDIYVIPANEN